MTAVPHDERCESCGEAGCFRRILGEDEPNFHVYVWICLHCGHEQDQYEEYHHTESITPYTEPITPYVVRRWVVSLRTVAAILILAALGIGTTLLWP